MQQIDEYRQAIQLAIQRYFNIFAFFVPLGFIKIAGISLSFLIFVGLLLFTFRHNKKFFTLRSKDSILLLLLLMLFTLSYLFQENSLSITSAFSNAKLLIQYYYWIVLALFVIKWQKFLDFYQLSRSLFWGTIVFIGFYYSVNPILKVIPQNFFAFCCVVLFPLSLYYCYSRFNVVVSLFVTLIFLMSATLSQSRTGTIIVLVQVCMLLILMKPKIRKLVAGVLVVCIPVGVVLLTSTNLIEDSREQLSEWVMPFNERAAKLIKSEDYLSGDEADRSWLTRKLMVQKGLKIFEKHPFLGIGIGNFTRFEADLDLYHPRMSRTLAEYNRRSAHNTYIQVLTESGIFALILCCLILFIGLARSAHGTFALNHRPSAFIFVAILGMVVYFYAIAAITGAITWLLIALSLTGTKLRDTL